MPLAPGNGEVVPDAIELAQLRSIKRPIVVGVHVQADYTVKHTYLANNLFLLSTACSDHIKTYTHLKEHIKESLT